MRGRTVHTPVLFPLPPTFFYRNLSGSSFPLFDPPPPHTFPILVRTPGCWSPLPPSVLEGYANSFLSFLNWLIKGQALWRPRLCAPPPPPSPLHHSRPCSPPAWWGHFFFLFKGSIIVAANIVQACRFVWMCKRSTAWLSGHSVAQTWGRRGGGVFPTRCARSGGPPLTRKAHTSMSTFLLLFQAIW